MFLPIPRVEKPASDTDKGVVKVCLDETGPVTVYDGDRCGRGDGDMVRGDPDEFACKHIAPRIVFFSMDRFREGIHQQDD